MNANLIMECVTVSISRMQYVIFKMVVCAACNKFGVVQSS